MYRTVYILLLIVASLNVTYAADLSKYVPDKSLHLNGYNDIDSVKQRIAQRGVNSIEGLWQMAGNQAIVVIEPSTLPQLSGAGFNAYQIVVVSSPRKSIRPGTVLGYMSPAARENCFFGTLYTSHKMSFLHKKQSFTINMTGEQSFLSLSSAKPKWRVSLRHTFNFFVRTGISNRPNLDEPAPDGFIKLYPAVSGPYFKPVYL